MRQVARYPCINDEMQTYLRGTEEKKKGHHKGRDLYQKSAKDTNRVQKGKESSGAQNREKGNVRKVRESVHQREPGEHISESSARSPTIRGAVSSKPVRWEACQGGPDSGSVNIRNWSNTGSFGVGERAI